jgi:hypothetical protein
VATADRERTELVVTREREEAWIVNRLLALPAQHDRLLTVVLGPVRAAAEPREGASVAVHQRVEVVALVEPEVLPLADDEHVREGLHDGGLARGEPHLVRRPVALRHLAWSIVRRRQARCRLGRRPDRAQVLLDAGVAAGEALRAQDLEHALRRDVGVLRDQRRDPRLPSVELRRPRRSRRARRDRELRHVLALRCVRVE